MTLDIFGGAGKAPTLVVFRSVLPGVGRADEGGDVVPGLGVEVVVFKVGTAGVE